MIAARAVILAASTAFSAAAETRFDISLDPRLELAGVVEALSASSAAFPSPAHPADFTLPRRGGLARIEKRFGSLRGHPAVRFHALPSFRGISYNDRRQVLLRLSMPPALEAPSDLADLGLVSAVGGEELLERWIEGLREFARDSRFMEYHRDESFRIESELSRFRKALLQGEYLAKIEEYTGLPFRGRIHFFLSRFYMHGAAVTMVRFEDDSIHVAMTAGVEEDAPPWDDLRYAVFPDEVWHESAHGILDERTDRFTLEDSVLKAFVRPPARDCQDPGHCVREHVAVGVAARLVRAEQGDLAAEKVLAEAEEGGLLHIRAVENILSEYEADRKRYPTLAAFYPRLLGADLLVSGARD